MKEKKKRTKKQKTDAGTIRNIWNIWNKRDFIMSGFGHKNRPLAYARHLLKCIKWSRQRITRGYADCDVWDMYGFLQEVIPAMLQNLKKNRCGSPGFLGENYINEDGILVNDSCHEEWDKILTRMIFLWRESNERTCRRKNRFEKEFFKAFDEFDEKYGILGEKLQTEEELEENRRRGGGGTVHFMSELPEYKEISDRYYNMESQLEKYRGKCKDEAIDMLKEYFFSLWD